MIFPRLLGGKAGGGIGSKASWQRASWQRKLATCVGVVALALAVAFGLRAYSVAHLSSYFADDVAIVSPARLDTEEIQQAYRVARSDHDLDARLAAEPKLLAYVVPADWFLPDLPLHTEEEIRRVGGGHRTPSLDSRTYRVLFTRPRLHSKGASGSAILTRAYGHEPLAIARVDLETGSVIGMDEVPDHVIWGDIPTPLF